MEENMVVNGQELVDMACQKVEEAAKNLDDKIVETGLQVSTNLPAAVSSQQKSWTGMNIAVGVGLTLGGGAIGFAFDHWGLPALNKAWENHKAKKAEKKAAKAAKKAAKEKAKKSDSKPAEAKEAAAETKPEQTPGIDPMSVNPTID